ncbi:hypothetical protein ES319_D08G147700v1 [Gossypium barbadense]|uniref:Uncharacterized protein n=2 Tax=Gossypium TaxID=3633 RepID=A0A5J5QFW9_GOSBA|nr:hypothetical protein ES319_D08G147700v1 [Gossypium barbadense]TYG57617.1 hypothetical protein ES288_D08G157600v1 [Gossypium darwinii]
MVSASPSTTTTSLRFISIPISIACRHANASAAKGLDRSLNAASKINFNIGGSSGLHRSISIHRPGFVSGSPNGPDGTHHHSSLLN